MRQGNFLEEFPLSVVMYEDKYLLWDGARRLAAAKKIGMTHVTVLISDDLTPEEALQRQLSVLLREPQPVVVLDEDANVVAGICWAVHQLTDGRPEATRKNNIEVAHILGEKPDTISAYRALFFEELPEMKRRVAKGDIAITVYSRLKHQSTETKIAILQKSGTISRSYVDDFLRSQREGILHTVDDGETAVADNGSITPTEYVKIGEYSGPSVTAVLQKVKGLLRSVAGEDLQETDYLILDEIDDLLGEFK
jgi:hypothetical protein